jgi:hypothetical protein
MANSFFLLQRVCFLRIGGEERAGPSEKYFLVREGNDDKMACFCRLLLSLYRWAKCGDDSIDPTHEGEAVTSKLSLSEEPHWTDRGESLVLRALLPEIEMFSRRVDSISAISPERSSGEYNTSLFEIGGILTSLFVLDESVVSFVLLGCAFELASQDQRVNDVFKSRDRK